MISAVGDGLPSPLAAQLYDWEHDEFQDDVELYAGLGQRTGGPGLEIACGTGRVLAGLARIGLEVVGLDRSEEMLHRARTRLRSAGARVTLVQGDLNEGLPRGPFALIVLTLDAFGLVRETAQQIALLRRVREALKPGGILVLDLVHTAALADQPEGIPILQRSAQSLEIGAYVTKWMVRRIYPAAQEIHLLSLYDLSWGDGSLRRLTDSTRLRYFSRYEVQLLIEAGGLGVEAVYGDYSLGPLLDGSERMIVVAGRRGSRAV